MVKSRFDRVLTKMENRIGRVSKKIEVEFKGKDPFDSVKVTDADRIAQYLATTPQERHQYINDFGEQYINYEQKMEQKIREYGNG